MKQLRWCISVLVSLVPIVFTAMVLLNRGREWNIGSVAGRGELALIAVAMCAGGVVELIGSGKEHALPKGLAGGGALLVVLLASLYFADVSALIASGSPPSAGLVASVSRWLFVVGFFCTGGCVMLGEE